MLYFLPFSAKPIIAATFSYCLFVALCCSELDVKIENDALCVLRSNDCNPISLALDTLVIIPLHCEVLPDRFNSIWLNLQLCIRPSSCCHFYQQSQKHQTLVTWLHCHNIPSTMFYR